MDTRSVRGKKDVDRPARMRWGFINRYLQRYLTYVDIGPISAKFTEPMKFSLINHFDKPRLRVKPRGEPVMFEDLPMALSKGPYKDPKISKVYFYSILEGEEALYNEQFYGAVRNFAKRRFGVSFPSSMLPLDRDLSSVRIYLEKAQERYGRLDGICLAIVKEDSPLHDDLIGLFGDFSLPVQCVTVKTAIEDVCFSRNVYITENICAMMIAKTGGIPWVLYDELNYGCYCAIDIGRTKAEHWAMAVVYNRKGMFEALPGRMTVGERLDEQSIDYCMKEASNYAGDSSDFILLRHGKVYPTEVMAFENVAKNSPFKNCAIVSVKTEEVPFRIFREVNGKIVKPLSGDYYPLGESTVVVCTVGVDEYTHGMPKPITIEVIPATGRIEAVKAARDTFYLSYLNWGSPRQAYSMPAPLRLAHTLASELSAGIQRGGQPF
jgi:hypothetical protein